MLKLIVGILILAAGGYVFPQLYEGTPNACMAIESKAIRRVAEADADAARALMVAAGFSKGQLARAAAEREYPNLPGGLVCVIGYYDLNPTALKL